MNAPVKGTITIKTPAAVVVTLITVIGTVVGSYLASGKAVENELLDLKYQIMFETQDRKNADDKFDMKIANNIKAIEAVNSRVDALRPSTVTTFR
jgi:hypothetical protein